MHYWGVASLTQVAVTDSYLQGFPSANWRPGMEPVDHEINTVINKKNCCAVNYTNKLSEKSEHQIL